MPQPSTARGRSAVDSTSPTRAHTASSADAAASTSAPTTNMRRRPWSSPIAPAGSSATARPQLIELRIHACPLGPAPSADAVAASVPTGVV